jgi:hypothetical protein
MKHLSRPRRGVPGTAPAATAALATLPAARAPAAAAETPPSRDKAAATTPSTENATTRDGIVGYAAHKVADSVNEHEAWAPGSHGDHTSDDTIVRHHGFQVPGKPGIRMRHLQVIPPGGRGRYRHVVNDTGAPTSGTDTVPSEVTRFPWA